MADAADSKSAAPCGRVGSTSTSGTRSFRFCACRPESPSLPRGERGWGVGSSALLAVDHVDPGSRLVRAALREGHAHVVADLEVGEAERLAGVAHVLGVGVGLEGRGVVAVLDGERLSGGVDRGDVTVHTFVVFGARLFAGEDRRGEDQEQGQTQDKLLTHTLCLLGMKGTAMVPSASGYYMTQETAKTGPESTRSAAPRWGRAAT